MASKTKREPHIGIIGGGPAGYVAALHAAALGAKVTLAEAGDLGGTCLHRGCIPTKRLVTTGHLLERLRNAAQYGISLDGTAVPVWPDITDQISRLTAGLAQGIHGLMENRQIELVQGRARPIVDGRPALDFGQGERIGVDRLLLSTGSHPRLPPGLTTDGEYVCTSDDVLDWRELPKSALIIGGGVIACEFAFILASLGVEVTVTGRAEAPLPGFEPEISRQVLREFKRRRVRFIGGTSIDRVEPDGATVHAYAGDTEVARADRILVCTGRTPNSDGLGEAVGIRLGSGGEVPVDNRMRTAVPDVYAAGDVTGGALLAHAASAQGKVAVEHMLGRSATPYVEAHVPVAVFTHPEVGCVGLTEAAAREQGMDVVTSRFELRTLGRAQAMGETSGFVKLVAMQETHTLLGAHIVGPCASELVHEAAVVIRRGGDARELAATVHAHPTLSEGIQEAAEDLFGHAIHKPIPSKREVKDVSAV